MSSVIKRILRWCDETASKGQLARMDKRMLDDLGMAPKDFAGVISHLG